MSDNWAARTAAALALARRALGLVEAHARAGHLRCPVCQRGGGVASTSPHDAGCALALALAALDGLVPTPEEDPADAAETGAAHDRPPEVQARQGVLRSVAAPVRA
jgi:hypothetical protein